MLLLVPSVNIYFYSDGLSNTYLYYKYGIFNFVFKVVANKILLKMVYFCVLGDFNLGEQKKKHHELVNCLPGVLGLFCGSSTRCLGWTAVCDCDVS